MWTDINNNDYSANYTGTRMLFFYKGELQCELDIRSRLQARQMLADWARLKIPPPQVKFYQDLVKGYVGATVDDVTITEDGKSYCINGKPVANI